METNGISNHYIDRLMEQVSYNFRGTFSADNIPIFQEDFFSIIVNLSSEGEKGSHFIAISSSASKILYFDSFGSQQTNSSIEQYLKRYRKQIIFTNNQIQHLFSSHCGFFCISFILCMENMISLKNFFKMFHQNNLSLNDYICIDIITFFINHMYLRKSISKDYYVSVNNEYENENYFQKMQNSKKLSLSKIKKLLVLFKYIIVQKSGNKNTVLRYLNDESINDISESIHNLLYNEKLNSLFSRLQKTKLKRIIKHNVKSFEDISRKKVPIIKRRKKIIQHGKGIGTILLTLIPILSSFLAKK